MASKRTGDHRRRDLNHDLILILNSPCAKLSAPDLERKRRQKQHLRVLEQNPVRGLCRSSSVGENDKTRMTTDPKGQRRSESKSRPSPQRWW
jgi:hypothetical protein